MNSLRLDFGAFTLNHLGSKFVRLFLSVLAEQPGANKCLKILSYIVKYRRCVKGGGGHSGTLVRDASFKHISGQSVGISFRVHMQ
jgi:hypothetical protein